MACKTSHEFHHHFPKIAEESGFTFNIHKPRVHIDWNKIRSIDIESLIRERNFCLIERHLNDILYCVLESEFDVRILDEGVLKMFRLAQLAVEYQQFCRHYLDRSVHVLREELTTLVQELDATKRDLREKEEEIKKFRKRTKLNFKSSLPYGNDNIATMILKTLSNKSDIFPSVSNVDMIQYNKCSYCDKVFLNQLYLRSHISRRHLNVIEMPQKDVENVQNIPVDKENSKLSEEIMELKAKIKEMEYLITRTHNQPNTSNLSENPEDINKENLSRLSEDKNMGNKTNNIEAKMKDAEVSTSNDDYLLDKIEEWKKEENDKYKKEINLLRTQILESINSFKEKDTQRSFENESNIIEQLHTTIKQQGTEIFSLKQELTNTKLLTEKEENERRKIAEAQMSFWTQRVEAQSKQYESLLQKLNEVAKEAFESRELAKAEHERAAQLQDLLEQAMSFKSPLNNEKLAQDKKTNTEDNGNPKSSKHNFIRRQKPVTDSKTLESLHRKAQELLNIGSCSSSEISSTSVEEIKLTNTDKNKIDDKSLPKNRKTCNTKKKKEKLRRGKNTKLQTLVITDKLHKQEPKQVIENKEQKRRNSDEKFNSNISDHIKNSSIRVPTSPIKIIRAKLVEEVNSRLVSVGVDPLKCRLPQNIFQKQRIQLQQQNESKSKKIPDYQKVRHSILTYLDANVPSTKKETLEPRGYISPSKISKPFSIGSVISNVKSKALSLVKSNDINSITKNKTFNSDVAKQAMTLLNTPPGSGPASPIIKRKLIENTMKGISSAKETKHDTKIAMQKKYSNVSTLKEHGTKLDKAIITTASDTSDESNDSEHKYYNSAIIQDASKTLETLIKSPARRPSSSSDYKSSTRKNIIDSGSLHLVRAHSTTNVTKPQLEAKNQNHRSHSSGDSSDDIESLIDVPHKKSASEENVHNVPKQTKGVLKNALSTSSLNKKRVLFDMDAIQMKSVSASPSQSITEKSDANEKFELGLVNLDSEEWDISSIENEPLKNDTKIQNSRTSPKIAALKETIESQLARRNEAPRLVGGVDVLAAPMVRTSSIAGSNTSLGSSILDECEGIPTVNHKAFVKPKRLTEKDDSELDISEYSIEVTNNNKGNDSF